MRCSLRIVEIACVVLLVTSVPGLRVSAQQADDSLKHFENSIVPLPPPDGPTPAAVTSLKKKDQTTLLDVGFALPPQNQAELEARVAKGETLSPDELAKYTGDPASSKKLMDWLSSQGFKGINANSDNTTVYAKATAGQLEHSLGVVMKNVTFNGKTTPSATTAPSLPREVGDAVVNISGLQPWLQAVKRIVPRTKHGGSSAGPIPRPAAASKEPTYKIAEILKAYNADGLRATSGGTITGKGQTIAILIDTFPDRSDIRSFWKRNGLPIDDKRVQYIPVRNGTLPDREGEETLDVEWASGIAPGATIRVYAAGSLRYADLDRALDQIFADAQKLSGLRFLSVSLGLREDLVPGGERIAQGSKFLKLAALGVTTFVASGDAGSNPDASGHARSADVQVEYEASDPWVVSVGGTTLQVERKSGQVLSEIGWSDSGGGVSNVFPRQRWQQQYASIQSALRLVPDVSCVADSQPGAFVIFNRQEWPVGGTSWSAPIWAGFAALIGEAREQDGKPRLGFLAPGLYKLAGSGFREISSGSNGAYQAGPGWNPVTGIGVPNVRTIAEKIN